MSKRVLLSGLMTIASVLLGTPVVWAQSAFFTAVTNLNPVAYWPLQETVSPPVAYVETDLGSLGAVANAYYSSTNVARGASGIPSGDSDPAVNCVSGLNGSFLAVPLTDSRVALPAGPFTVEAWVYPTNATASTIIAQTGAAGSGGLNGGTNSAGWSLNLGYVPSLGINMGGTVTFHVYNGVGSTGGAEATFTPSSFALGTWYHVVAVFDGTNAVIYVNGVAGGSFVPMAGTQARDTWDPLTIGCGRGLNNNRFGGGLDEVAIYTNALSAARVTAHYNAGTGGGGYQGSVTTDSPYMYWRMDAPAYTAPAAYPATANVGTANAGGIYLSGTTPGVAGPSFAGLGSPSYACAFNGIGTDTTNGIPLYTNGVLFATNAASSGIMVTNLDSPLNLKSNSITAMVWFKANPSDSRYQGLVGHGDSSWKLSLNTDGRLRWSPGLGGDFASTKVYNDGNWHLVVGEYYNSGVGASPAGWLATNYIYVDGILDNSGLVTNSAATTSTTNVLLGGAPDYAPSGNGNVYRPQRFFSGSVAHVAYFTNALSASQVANLYATAGGVPLPAITGQPVTGRTNSPGTGNNGSGPGSYIFFGVNAIGANTYNWYFNSTSNYSGAIHLTDGSKYSSSSTLLVTVTNLADSDSGYYYVVVGNSFGSVTSILASFKVINEPFITSQTPAGGSLQLYQNQNYTLSVTAAIGETNFAYQWLTNGTADTTAGTGSTYQLVGIQTAMSGYTYKCVVTNSAGSATNSLVTLTVLPLPAALANSAYSSNLLALGPSGYWPMHEATAAATGDTETNLGSLGNLANGYYADWAQPAAGLTNIYHQVSGALTNDSDTATLFNNTANAATPGYLVIPRTSPATTLQAPFTLEAWAKPINAGFGDIISQGPWGANANGTSGPRNGIRMGWGSGGTSGNLNSDFVIFVGPGAIANPQFPGTVGQNLPIGQWYHIALVTADGTNWTFYVNGNTHYTFTLSMAIDSGDPIVVAQGLWQNNGPQRGFPGAIDEVAIYTNALQQSDLQTHYNDGIGGSAGQYKSDVLALNPIIYLRMEGT